MSSPFKVLQLPVSATKAQIRSRFFELSKKYHPDKLRNLSEDKQQEGAKKYQQIKHAYDQLQSDVEKYRTQDGGGGGNAGRGTEMSEDYDPYGSTRSARQYAKGSGHYRPPPQSHSRSRVYNHGRAYNQRPQSSGYRPPSDYDVPHFDFDKHYKQQQSYERHRQQQSEARRGSEGPEPPPPMFGALGIATTAAISFVLYSMWK